MKFLITALVFFKFCGMFSLTVLSQPGGETTLPNPLLSTKEHIEWFRNAKFGLFIHWGPYSQLAGQWNGQKVEVGKNAEWIMKFLRIPVDEYRNLARHMNPAKFDAREWVELAKETGMKYIVITAKHHDGFAMYDSQNPYNITRWTSFGRDPLKELAKVCEEEGIKFGVYYSHREDWDHPGGYGNNWDYDNDWGINYYHAEKFERYLEEKAKPQLRELLTNYGPLGLVWFDRGMYTKEQGLEFVRIVRDLQPSALINSRVGHYNKELLGDFQEMSDKGIPPGGLDEYFQTPQTLNETWGYSRFDTLWKSPETVIRQLIQVVSRGGNYLLNIGPKGDGSIPDTTIRIFKTVGPWVQRNAESIYGTSPNPFGEELDWGYCTMKGNKLYLFIRNWQKDKVITLEGLQNTVNSASLLVNRSVILPVNQENNKTHLTLATESPDDPVSVIVLQTEGVPEVEPPVVYQEESGEFLFDYLKANTEGDAMTRFNRKGGFHISKWTGPQDAVQWFVQVRKPGIFKVNITYSANKEWEGKHYEIVAGEERINNPVIATEELFEFHTFPAGYIEFSDTGRYRLTIRPVEQGNSYFMYLRSIDLQPVDRIKEDGWGAGN